MNLAVERSAPEGLTLPEYASYLSDKGYVPSKGKAWVDGLRRKDNQGRHHGTVLMNKTHAMDLIGFLEMLLAFIYGVPKPVPGGHSAANHQPMMCTAAPVAEDSLLPHSPVFLLKLKPLSPKSRLELPESQE